MGQDIVDGRYLEVLIRQDDAACEAGMSVVLRVAGRLGIDVHTVDVEAAPAGYEEFAHRVPVVRGPDGVVIAEGRIPAARILAALMRMTVTTDPQVH